MSANDHDYQRYIQSLDTTIQAMTVWKPTEVLEQLETAATSSACAVRVKTNAGIAYAKPLGGPHEPPSALACDYIGSGLGLLLGLPIPPIAICHLNLALVLDELGRKAISGPSFLSRYIDAEAWDGRAQTLSGLVNEESLAGIMVFDTWILNVDRYSLRDKGPTRINSRNLLLQEIERHGQRVRKLIWVIDHTHCLTRKDGGTFHLNPDGIDHIKSDRVMGLFPAFTHFITRKRVAAWIDRLITIANVDIEAMIARVPKEWEVSDSQRASLLRLISLRRDYLCENWESVFGTVCNWQSEITNPSKERS